MSIQIEDVEYRRHDDQALLMRIYRPRGVGPFPTLIDVHGGAWTSGDRLSNAETMTEFAERGFLTASLDFRIPPVAAYPAALVDINFAIRWLKAHAGKFGGTPDRIGGYGTSSGGHLVLLAAMRPRDLRYAEVAFPGVNDASLAYVISGWGVLDPLQRYYMARERGNDALVASHHRFWGTEEAMSEGSPPRILERAENVELPPALVFQGTAEPWTSVEAAQAFVSAYCRAGGEAELALFEGEGHGFLKSNANSPNVPKALGVISEFVRHQADRPR